MSVYDLLVKSGRFTQSRSYGGDDTEWHEALEFRLNPQVFPILYALHPSPKGVPSPPIFTIEQQLPDKTLNGHATMVRAQHHAQYTVDKHDEVLKLKRVHTTRQKKYAMYNNGDHGTNAQRKAYGVVVARNLFTQCNATGLLDFLDQTHVAGFEIDDLTDAFLLCLEAAIEAFVDILREMFSQLTPWNPIRTGTRDLESQIHGTVVQVAIDVGTVNHADCCVEVRGLLPGAEETYTTIKGEVKDHFLAWPIFRLRHWRLINLKTGALKAEYVAPADAPFIHRIYQDIGTLVVPLAKRPRKPSLKRERDSTEKKPRKKKARVLDLTGGE